MSRLLSIGILVSVAVRAQNVDDAAELFQKVRIFAETTKNWRAEVVETSHVSGRGVNLQDEVRTKLAVQIPLKMSRQNSGGDRTVFVCDGVETFYSGDGSSYCKGSAAATPQCDLPLSKFYELDKDPASIAAVGQDHVRLSGADRPCVVVRGRWRQGQVNTVRTMCIDVARPLILRDVLEREDEKTGMRLIRTITISNFEANPIFSPDAFRFSIPQGAVEAKRPH